MKPLPGQDPLAVVGGQRTGETELLARVAGLMKPHLKAHVNKFYATLGQRPGPARVIELLSSREFAHLKAVQVEHLRFLLDPGTDLAAVVDRGRDVGRVHAMAGVEMDWYAEAIADHQRGIFETVAPRAGSFDLARAIVVLNERFLADLKGALQGYRDNDAAQVAVVMQVSEAVARARTLPDLTRGVLEALGQLDGMVSAFIGRPDSSGDFALEAGVGDGVDERRGPMWVVSRVEHHGRARPGHAQDRRRGESLRLRGSPGEGSLGPTALLPGVIPLNDAATYLFGGSKEGRGSERRRA